MADFIISYKLKPEIRDLTAMTTCTMFEAEAKITCKEHGW